MARRRWRGVDFNAIAAICRSRAHKDAQTHWQLNNYIFWLRQHIEALDTPIRLNSGEVRQVARRLRQEFLSSRQPAPPAPPPRASETRAPSRGDLTPPALSPQREFRVQVPPLSGHGLSRQPRTTAPSQLASGGQDDYQTRAVTHRTPPSVPEARPARELPARPAIPSDRPHQTMISRNIMMITVPRGAVARFTYFAGDWWYQPA
ncbi:hypothetical protein OPT61_g9520 [Boeremia exigua]|uniref:Uncharacterized protein n=1 Tax=Boeremia exigua TaxID=749465 RepID=A0ACC2HUI4_9PLEO|nr:hypothetical protein OPT61_g9520 [Boeremia exigua]